MTRRVALALGALLIAASAVAIDKGDTLYIRSRNTRLVQKPNGKVLATLQPGEPVSWQGTVAGAPGWHHVKLKNGRRGALLTANLSTEPPQMELTSTQGGAKVDQATFLSSGAATKALAPAALEYGKGKTDMAEAVADVQAMERLSDAVTMEEVSAHAKSAGLPEAVGPGVRR